MRAIFILVCFVSISLACIGPKFEFDYFGLSRPKDKMELFGPNIVSLKKSKEKSLAISPIGDEVFFTGGPEWPECKIMHVKKIGNQWSEPKVAEFSSDCYSTEPAFSPDGKYLYYSSSKGLQDIKQFSIWRVEKVGNEWSGPKKVIDIEDPNIMEFHPTITKDGNVYFCYWDFQKRIGSIYKSKYSGGVYSYPEKINIPFNVQSSVTDPYIDPDGEYIITSATRQDGEGDYDVYISFKGEDGSWSSPVNFGDRFNTTGDDDSFDISPDGKYVFSYKQDDVYWMGTKELFRNIRKTMSKCQ